MNGVICALLGLSVAATSAGPGFSPFKQISEVALAMFSTQSGNQISGYVFNDQRSPIEKVNVELLDDVDSLISRTQTNGSGRYVFSGLSSGTFQVRVLPAGIDYAVQTKRVQIVNFNRGSAGVGGNERMELDFTLVRRENAAPSARAEVIFVQDVPEAARKAYLKAVEALDSKKEGGIEWLKKALDSFPTYFAALQRLGLEYIQQQDYDAARNFLEKAVEVNPQDGPSWYALGVAQYNLKQIPEALISLNRSLSLNQNSINTNLWLGIALRQTDKLDEAESHLRQADKLAKGKVPEAHWQLALLYGNQLKRYKEAADELELFLKAQPDARDADKIKKLVGTFREKAKS